MSAINIRLGKAVDIEGAKRIADQHRSELGFVNMGILRAAQNREGLLVASKMLDEKSDVIVGFANFRLRRDRNVTLYEIAVADGYKGKGIGKRLLNVLIRRAHLAGGEYVRLKCPLGLRANSFYSQCGFEHVETERGKKRVLKVWHYFLPLFVHRADILSCDGSVAYKEQLVFPFLSEVIEDGSGVMSSKITSAEFYASLTIGLKEIETLHTLWHKESHKFDWQFGVPNPFRRVLISPLVASRSTLDFVRKLKESGETEVVMFDSGGYFVQTGKLSYSVLYQQLKRCYRQEDWADIYVLPDHPLVSSDSLARIEEKVRETVEDSLCFFNDLSTRVQERSMPVVHAKGQEHLDYCLEHYEGFRRVGFGAFSTSGPSQSTNRLEINTLMLLEKMVRMLELNDAKLHIFWDFDTAGDLFVIAGGVHSFDSAGWMRSGGYGKVFLPFMIGALC